LSPWYLIRPWIGWAIAVAFILVNSLLVV
jgi:hypothetical protein